MSALRGLRVIETAESPAGEYCGKLLADFGADVVKVERPGVGSPTRSMHPLIGSGPEPENSGLFAYLNTNKRSVVCDPSTEAGAGLLHGLIAGAHAVVDDHDPTWLVGVGLSPGDVERRYPELVVCSITPYGHHAPPQTWNAQSLNVFHASGWGFHTPSHADPSTAPLKGPGRFLVDYEAGLDAALCVVACLYGLLHGRPGRFVDVSEQAVMASRSDCVTGRFVTGEITPEGSREDYDQQGPASFFPCADGYVYLYVTSTSHWRALKDLLGHPAWLDGFDDDWLEFSVTREKVARFHDGFARWVSDEERVAVSERAQRIGVPLVPVNDASDLPESAQYRHRGFFREVHHPVLGTVRHPTVPYLLSASPAVITSAAPALGEHTDDPAWLGDRPTVVATQHRRPGRSRGGPLAGIRVVELTKVWAGPYAGKLLAFLGAEVIKVETSTRPEEMRAYGGTDVDHAPFFLSINPEILSVDLDIKTPAGMDQLRALIAESDVVVNNLRPGAMERQGLGHPDLAAIRPDIISVSIKMWGNDGPLGYQTGYAPCFAALSGLAALVGHPGGGPLGTSMRYGDSTVGAAAAFAALAALVHRETTGEGQFVDLSAVETLSSMAGDSLVEHALTGRPMQPDGNRHPDMAPHGCYPCRDGTWLSLAVVDDEQWRRLCQTLSAPGQLASAYGTRTVRLAGADALDDELAALTRDRDVDDLVQRLRAAGVPAAKSATALDVIADDMLWARECFRFVSDHVEGLRPVLGASWRMSTDNATIENGAPNLGEHDGYVFGDVLGAPSRSN
ncbi:putative CoA-transferase [Mycolicibacterium madagascariense]|uniref:Putative CoA-transferase n=1 Tax=Mycolicibacterium madagascariense TaxID=212765 RepID=A0A7I7XAC2_9MYCO|nr:CoA transferase [Mycolicibacterium madagascariense]MCV7011857.1 CoA transferase [Mycolicibacterium madagascariense]BBZ26290.1 putative CoA-transferase [Mycolicibacterium madagascariense]